ncbi:hypothetical protein V511_01460 [Mesotoga sp. Brook.08.YT.4.2.5.1]|nr:hypothetical protein V511_01460 [Mesotoga sp. Brook.08.YT.4.2.5.1]RAO95581.1 hypothetical protein M388_03565 [Mesotoga sp. Brook.08.YT.4.2.5.4.]RDI90788.1 hypothetical protein Q502_12780 [Mesotoga sp. Brook.08.YT.4.2.5.2.]
MPLCESAAFRFSLFGVICLSRNGKEGETGSQILGWSFQSEHGYVNRDNCALKTFRDSVQLNGV